MAKNKNTNMDLDPLTILRVDEDNVRQHTHKGDKGNDFGDGVRVGIKDLQASIRRNGFTSSLIVREHTPDEYEETGYPYRLVAAFGRHTALTTNAKGEPLEDSNGEAKAMLPTVPCIVLPADATPLDIALAQWDENNVRQDLTPAEKAEGVYRFVQVHGLSVAEAAKKTGISRPYASNLNRIREHACEAVWNDFAKGAAFATVRNICDSGVLDVEDPDVQRQKWAAFKMGKNAGDDSGNGGGGGGGGGGGNGPSDSNAPRKPGKKDLTTLAQWVNDELRAEKARGKKVDRSGWERLSDAEADARRGQLTTLRDSLQWVMGEVSAIPLSPLDRKKYDNDKTAVAEKAKAEKAEAKKKAKAEKLRAQLAELEKEGA